MNAELAQLVEQLICNHQVVSSNLTFGSIKSLKAYSFEAFVFLGVKLMVILEGHTCLQAHKYAISILLK